MNNGNGKIDPGVITAQQCVAMAERPLREQEKRIATTKHRLSECESALMLAQKENNDIADRFVEDHSEANKRALIESNADVVAARTRVEGFRKKLAAEEAAIIPVRAEHDTVMIQLAQVQEAANLAHLEDVWSAAREAVNKLEEQLITAKNVCAEAERRFKMLDQQRRESRQAQAQRTGIAHHLLNNPREPGLVTRTRQGF